MEDCSFVTDSSPVTVAAFDLDGTLTNGGSVFKWLRYVSSGSRAWKETLKRFAPLSWGIVRSGDAADRAKESLFAGVLRGRDAAEVAERSREFALEHLEQEGRTVYLERLQWHLDQGHHVVVVSASPDIYVSAIAHALGAEASLGTRLAIDPLGRLTGGYLGKNCRGDEKNRRLMAWIEGELLGEPVEIYAYGNSRGDRKMLAAADHAFDAGKLGRLGAMRSFERLSTP